MVTFALARTKESIPVATKHIPYLEALWNTLDASKKSIAAKKEYLQVAQRIGREVAAVSSVADRAKSDGESVVDGENAFNRIKQILAAGGEPTTPPIEWFCGRVITPMRLKNGRYPDETWPGKRHYQGEVRVYQGAMPVMALERYAAMKDLVDGTRIYSPSDSDFEQIQKRIVYRDPVMIGSVAFLERNLYFELARWDIDKDLANVFGSSMHQKSLGTKETPAVVTGRLLESSENW